VVTTNIEGRRLAAEELPPGSFEIAEYPWQSPDQLDVVVEGIAGPGGLGGDLPGSNRIPLDEKFAELRRVLLPPEIERYRDLAQDAALAVESVCRAVALRDSELQVAARVAALCYEKKMLPAVNLVAADERVGRYRHPVPTANRVDSTMLVALTAQRGGLHISLTRTLCFGEPEPDQVFRHAACARVDARMILASRPGATLGEIVAGGVDQYAAEGFPDEWRHHHQGGLTGYSGREIFATPTTDYTLQANQALAWNPSITGAKSEDTILVTDNGAEILTSTGHWPTLEVDVEGQTVLRPGLLIR
jgi:Xaa-Pro aminopeptidase